jgi:hypothetical protein
MQNVLQIWGLYPSSTPTGDEIEENSLPSTPTPLPAALRSVTKAPGSAPASVSANAFSNPSRAGGGAGKGLTQSKSGRDNDRIGGLGNFPQGGFLSHWGPLV